MWFGMRVLMFLAIAAPAAAQTSSSLTGVIRDPSGGVVVGATVIIDSADSSFSRIVESGRDGMFILS